MSAILPRIFTSTQESRSTIRPTRNSSPLKRGGGTPKQGSEGSDQMGSELRFNTPFMFSFRKKINKKKK